MFNNKFVIWLSVFTLFVLDWAALNDITQGEPGPYGEYAILVISVPLFIWLFKKIKKKVVPTVAILVYQNDKVLLVKYDQEAANPGGSYCLPSGHIKTGETDIAAAVRKLENETGLKTEEKNLFTIPIFYSATFHRRDGLKSFSMKVFLCRGYQGKLRPGLHENPEWVKISEIKKYPLLPNVEKAVLDGLKYR